MTKTIKILGCALALATAFASPSLALNVNPQLAAAVAQDNGVQTVALRRHPGLYGYAYAPGYRGTPYWSNSFSGHGFDYQYQRN